MHVTLYGFEQAKVKVGEDAVEFSSQTGGQTSHILFCQVPQGGEILLICSGDKGFLYGDSYLGAEIGLALFFLIRALPQWYGEVLDELAAALLDHFFYLLAGLLGRVFQFCHIDLKFQ